MRDADDLKAIVLVSFARLGQERELLTTRVAPRRPEVDHEWAAAEVGDLHTASVKGRQREVGHAIADVDVIGTSLEGAAATCEWRGRLVRLRDQEDDANERGQQDAEQSDP